MIENGFRKSKNSSIVLVAESEVTGGAMGVAERVKKEYPQFDVRVSILGHCSVVVLLRHKTGSWRLVWVWPRSMPCWMINVT